MLMKLSVFLVLRAVHLCHTIYPGCYSCPQSGSSMPHHLPWMFFLSSEQFIYATPFTLDVFLVPRAIHLCHTIYPGCFSCPQSGSSMPHHLPWMLFLSSEQFIYATPFTLDVFLVPRAIHLCHTIYPGCFSCPQSGSSMPHHLPWMFFLSSERFIYATPFTLDVFLVLRAVHLSHTIYPGCFSCPQSGSSMPHHLPWMAGLMGSSTSSTNARQFSPPTTSFLTSRQE